jgi:putative ABC transport system ATP-binding protein
MIEIEALEKHYGSGSSAVAALRGIDLRIERGEILALVGPSGSGKTTLLNILGCLDRPTAGEVRLDGRNIHAMDHRETSRFRARHLGFVFQSFNLFSVLSAFENVEFPLLLAGVPAAERRERVLQALREVGLEGKVRRRPDELSGGEKQRVAIARALVHRPLLVLADEPTANLDLETGAAIIELMCAMNREHGTTMLICTHDPAVLRRVRRVVSIRDGRITGDRLVEP